LKHLDQNCDLNNPLSLEQYIFSKDWKNKSRNNYFNAYQHYCVQNGIQWQRPKLKEEVNPIKIPTEEKIDSIIEQCSLKYATIYSISKHGLRPDEVSKITLRDIDLENRMILVRTSKLGKERNIRLSRRANDILKQYVHLQQITDISKRLFPEPKTLQNQWRYYRKLTYQIHKDTELLKIRLYDLRHWFGTTEYLKTRDIFQVKYLMGHRHIESTLHYMHVAKGLVNYKDYYTVKIASNIEDFINLLENGFEYVSDYGENKVLRKRK